MTHAGHTRNFDSTLRMLGERGHDVHIAVDQHEKKGAPDLNDLLHEISEEHPNITMGSAPRVSKTDWAPVGVRMRATLDLLSYTDSVFDRSDAYRDRAELAVPRPLRPMARSKPGRSVLRSTLGAAEARTPVSQQIREYISEQRPDAVLITPLVQLGSPQLDYLRAARRLGVPSALLVHSWDNLTVKGLIHEAPDIVTVWNAHQKREAVELHGVPEERVEITGAASYDHWFDWKPSSSKAQFCKRLGLEPDKPIVLYVGSSKFIAPKEGDFIRQWATDLADEPSGVLPEFQILVRPHPTIPLSGPVQARLEALGNVVVYPPRGANPTNREARVDYFDSMYHSAAVVGVNTTAFIESAIVNRPVLAPLSPRYRNMQKGSQHFQYLLPGNGGMLNIATSPHQHAEQLALALRGEDTTSSERNRMFVSSFIRPLGIDRPATPFLVDALEGLADVVPARPPPASLPAKVAGEAITKGGRMYLSYRVRRNRARKRADVDRAERVREESARASAAVKAKAAAEGRRPKSPTEG